MEIMDQNGKGEEMNDYVHKSCTDFKTTKTPLWRSGPYGPKSLCNACGIRYRKKSAKNDDGIEIETSNYKRKIKVSDEELKNRVMALGKEVVVLQQQPRSPPVKKRRSSGHQKKKYWKKMGEVEQAAVMLMALSSCGSVLAPQNIEGGEEVL